jgi:hypothetical protein
MWRDLFAALKDMLTWWVTVVPWEQSVRVRMGKHVKLLEAGIHLRIPILDKFYIQSSRLRYISIPTQTVSTLDGKILTISCGAGFVVKDILKLYNTLHDPEDTIQMIASGIVADIIYTTNADDLRPYDVEQRVMAKIDFDEYGLGDVKYCITDWAMARTYRLIQGEPKDWGARTGDFDTSRESKSDHY